MQATYKSYMVDARRGRTSGLAIQDESAACDLSSSCLAAGCLAADRVFALAVERFLSRKFPSLLPLCPLVCRSRRQKSIFLSAFMCIRSI